MEKNEIKERQHLSHIKNKLNERRAEYARELKNKKEEIKEDTIYRGEARSDMDHGEKITIRQAIEEKVTQAERLKERIKKIDKLIDSPYFGRFDFEKNQKQAKKIYLGIHNFYDHKNNQPIIFDWRAPISSLYYDYEIGPATYESPSGLIKGEVTLKRQFRIRDGEMEFMIESAVAIMDDVLQKELSRASDESMKNIVATIQRDQNSIIRDENSQALIIQGVAGSGKTSIALHRIAFLLYRFKENLSADDILIISPNKVFADYISNVLPELDEEMVGEIQMEAIARELLGFGFQFQTFFEQSAFLLDKEDEELKYRIKTKASAEFLKTIDKYISHIKKDLVTAKDINIGGCYVPSWLFEDVFSGNIGLSKRECVKEVTNIIREKINLEYDYLLNSEETKELNMSIEKMHKGRTLRQTYIDMFAWINKPELFKMMANGKWEYGDVFPLAYLKICLEGKKLNYGKIKHLVIDEMQDYTSIQYAVIKKLFKCNKTILGDIGQSVNPYSASSADTIKNTFTNAAYVELNKSYRSTCEIMALAQKIYFNPKLETIERHGGKPRIAKFMNSLDEEKEIIRMAHDFLKSEYNSLGIITKTQMQAEKLYAKIKKANIESTLLTEESESFNQGVIISAAHMAKGLEFDEVIVPEASAKNYFTQMDRSLLYVACTRAMHKLTLTYTTEPAKFIS